MKLPVIAICTMLTAFALPATADTVQTRTAEFNGAPGQARTLLYNGESTDTELVKRKHRHRHHHRYSRHRHHDHHHYYRPYYRPYYYRPYYYDPYRYSYPRSGFYFRVF